MPRQADGACDYPATTGPISAGHNGPICQMISGRTVDHLGATRYATAATRSPALWPTSVLRELAMTNSETVESGVRPASASVPRFASFTFACGPASHVHHTRDAAVARQMT